ncbi:MAG: SMP-30/gluconolactonase/LRE family protein [Salinisphaeraceae bacterium]|nr:SMP-30/gluconolactonase/LRE family protein [Salinisphaeraceae bacterium]
MRWVIIALLLAAVGYLCLWPVPINPYAWEPTTDPGFTGPYAVNNALAGVERFGQSAGNGPEDVAVDDRGRVFVGFIDGRIMRFDPDGKQTEVADTGGRPLGLDFAPSGDLIIADGYKGLLAMNSNNELRLLASEADGLPFAFTDDVDVAPDGSIYFSDASSKLDPSSHGMNDAIEHGPYGRLLRYEPATGNTEVLLDGLYFANGIAVGPDEAYVLVNQTMSYDVLRYWLKGPKAGSAETFIDELPGFPDGISFNGKDTFWLAIFAPRNPILDKTAGQPFLRKVIYRLPEFLKPKPVPHAIVLGLNENGEVIHNLQDASDTAYAPVTSAEEAKGWLYLGSLTAPGYARIKAPTQ